MKVNKQISYMIESNSIYKGITLKESAEELLKEFETDNLISSAAQVQMYLDNLERRELVS